MVVEKSVPEKCSIKLESLDKNAAKNRESNGSFQRLIVAK